MAEKKYYRTVWLSDIHLGSKDCKAEYLLDFLKHTKIDTLFLVGDIIDLWALTKQFRWPPLHNELLHTLISLPESGTEVIYLPGNHDEPAQKYDNMIFGEIKIHREYIYTTAKGKKLLLLHGDQLDDEVCFGRFHAWIGDKGYSLLLLINHWYNALRFQMGYPYRSLAGKIKSRVRGANQAIARYRQAAINKAKKAGVDGIVCGHIHHPEIREIDGLTYYNDGDWVENCSALTEDRTGNISLSYWTSIKSTLTLIHSDNKNNRKAA